MEDNLQTENTMNVNDQIKGYLVTASKWGKFLSIVGFIGLGFFSGICHRLYDGSFSISGNAKLQSIPFHAFTFRFCRFHVSWNRSSFFFSGFLPVQILPTSKGCCNSQR